MKVIPKRKFAMGNTKKTHVEESEGLSIKIVTKRKEVKTKIGHEIVSRAFPCTDVRIR
jgi:hypothetical protein